MIKLNKMKEVLHMKFFLVYLISFVLNSSAQINENLYFQKGSEFEEKGKFKKAFKYFEKAALTSNNHLYYVKAAEIYVIAFGSKEKKDLDKVMWLYNKSLTIKSWNEETLLSRAQFFEFKLQHKLALEDLDSLIKRIPSNTTAYTRKAAIYMTKKDTITAFKVYDEILIRSDSLSRALILMEKGAQCYIRDFWNSATISLQKGINIKGKQETPNYYICMLASAYLHIGKSEKACEYYKLCDHKQPMNLKGKKDLDEGCR